MPTSSRPTERSSELASRTLAKAGGGNVTLFAFDAGEGLSEHRAPFDALILVVDGRLSVTIGGDTVEADQGDLVRLPADIPHAVEAPVPARMLLVMLRDLRRGMTQGKLPRSLHPRHVTDLRRSPSDVGERKDNPGLVSAHSAWCFASKSGRACAWLLLFNGHGLCSSLRQPPSNRPFCGLDRMFCEGAERMTIERRTILASADDLPPHGHGGEASARAGSVAR